MNHNIEGLYIFKWHNGDIVDYIDFSDEYISKKFDIEMGAETKENSNQEKGGIAYNL
jgi:hypothetical protein